MRARGKTVAESLGRRRTNGHRRNKKQEFPGDRVPRVESGITRARPPLPLRTERRGFFLQRSAEFNFHYGVGHLMKMARSLFDISLKRAGESRIF